MTEPGGDRVTKITHRGLGPMLRLAVSEGYSFDLTFQEARTLSRALRAVKDKQSSVDEIYLSPIASDGDFHAKVQQGGLLIEALSPPLTLSWSDVGVLAEALAALAPEA